MIQILLFMVNKPLFVVGIGASAGGLDALKEFFASIKNGFESVSFVVAQHVSPSHKSMLVQLIEKETSLTVSEAIHNQSLKSATIYITPPNHQIDIVDGKIQLTRSGNEIGPKPSVDRLFESLSKDKKDRSIGVILSGTGSDGTDGIYHIKRYKGLVLSQQPDSAKYDGMPVSAIDSGNVDIVDTPSKLWSHIKDHIEEFESNISYEPVSEEEEQIEVIYNLLSRRTGTDFAQYKTSTIFRRLDKRIASLGLKDLNEYLSYLEGNKDEINELYDTLLIGYTYFMRDEEAFKSLRINLQTLFENKADNEALRIWVPGCASGEEAYSIAIILSEYFKKNIKGRQVQIFATDIDEHAIDAARKGIFDARALVNLSDTLIDKYFMKSGDRFEISKQLRSMILFSRHDLAQNPPFLRLDMITCRNVLIYFNNDLQKHIIPLFHHALRTEGILFLGKSETIGNNTDLFAVHDSKNRIYLKKYRPDARKSALIQYKTNLILGSKPAKKKPKNSISDAVGQTLLKSFTHPYVIVNELAEIIELKGDTKLFLSLPEGQMNANLYKLIDVPLQYEVRNILNKAIKEKEKFTSETKSVELLNHFVEVQITAEPLKGYDSNQNLFLVVFKAEEPKKRIEEKEVSEKDPSSKDKRIEELEKELDNAKQYLQNYIEELETSNEELQSLNEELQSTNEELQSSNEELETSNEELQSTTEEVQTAYAELKEANLELEQKENELIKTEANLKGLLENTLQSSILMNHKSEILEWNKKAANLFKQWGEQPESSTPISNYIPSPLQADFSTSLKKAMHGKIVSGKWELKTNGNVAHYIYNFTPIFDVNDRVDTISLGMMDITASENLQAEIRENEEMINSVFTNVDIGICLTDETGKFIRVNDQYCNIYGYTRDELIGQSFTTVVTPENRKHAQKMHDDFIDGVDEIPAEWKVMRKDGSIIDIQSAASRIELHDGSVVKITTVKDITENKKYKTLLEQAGHSAKLGGWSINSVNDEVEWTDEVFHIYGLDENEEINLDKALNAYPPEARETLQQALEDAQKFGVPYDLILPLNAYDGQKKWVRSTCRPIMSDNKVIKLLGTFQDVSDAKKDEDELKKLSLVATKTDNSVIITDKDGLIEWVNRAFTRLTGYSQNEVAGKKPGTILQGKDTDPLTRFRIARQLESGNSFSEQILNYKKNGDPYWLDMTISPIKDENGDIEKFISIQNDITDRIEIQDKLKESLNEKEVLLKEIHHRVKNNLAVIAGLFYLEMENSENEEVRKVLLDSQSRIKSIANVHELIYKNESFADVKLQQYLEDILQYLKDTFISGNKEITIKTDIDDVILSIDTAVPVALLFNELLVNTFKHAFNGEKDGEIRIRIKQADSDLKVSVQDNGVGMPTKVDPNAPSSLGMLLIHQFTNQLDGVSEWESEPEHGTKFTITFPYQK